MSDSYERRQQQYRAERERVARRYSVVAAVAVVVCVGALVLLRAEKMCGGGNYCGLRETWNWLTSADSWLWWAAITLAITVSAIKWLDERQ